MKNDKGRLATDIQYGDSYIHINNNEPCDLDALRQATNGATW